MKFGVELRIAGIDPKQGEVSKMEGNKCQHEQTREPHCPRKDSRLHRGEYRVFLRMGSEVFFPQEHREPDVSDDHGQHDETDEPEKGSEVAQMHRIRVDRIRSEKHGEVAYHVTDNEKHKHDAGERDYGLFANRRKQPGH